MPSKMIRSDGNLYRFTPGESGSLTKFGPKRHEALVEDRPSVAKVVPMLQSLRKRRYEAEQSKPKKPTQVSGQTAAVRDNAEPGRPNADIVERLRLGAGDLVISAAALLYTYAGSPGRVLAAEYIQAGLRRSSAACDRQTSR